MANFRSLVPGGFFSSDPADKKVPRSIRTNNPGAVNAANWVKKMTGFLAEQSDAAGNNTAVFEAPEYGVAVWVELMKRYRASLGDEFTLYNIRLKYSGGNMKTAADYTAFVSAKSGVSATIKISLSDINLIVRLAKAFFAFEAGRPTPLSDAQIEFGYRLVILDSTLDLQNIKTIPATGFGAPAKGRRAVLQAIAESEAKLELSWTSEASAAEKYLAPLRPAMIKLGHIGKKPVFFNWCAAFVTWCCRQSGYKIPDQPAGFFATMALVESWKYWGKQEGVLKDGKLKVTDFSPGDIILYEWDDGDVQLDHIGVFMNATSKDQFLAAEGNHNNRSKLVGRHYSSVRGIISLPD